MSEVGLKGCAPCGACCLDTHVALSGKDLLTFREKGLNPYEVVSFVNALIIDDSGSEAYEFRLNGERYLMIMNLKKIRFHEQDIIACNYFDEVNRNGRCKIYEQRPISCRIFPVGITDKYELTIPIVAKDTCFKNAYPKGIDSEELGKAFEFSSAFQRYAEVVGEWNKDPGKDFNQFIDFAIVETEKRKDKKYSVGVCEEIFSLIDEDVRKILNSI